MKQHVDRASRWIYSGIWAVLVRWFRVPDEPPTIPGGAADVAHSFRPAEGFLRYLKFYFWIALVLPKRGGIWPLEDRAKWLRLAAGIFDLGYKERDGAHSQEISIAVVKQEAANRPISPSMARSAAREQSIPTN